MKKRQLSPALSVKKSDSHFTSLKSLFLSQSALCCIAVVCFTALTCYWFWLAGRGFGNSDEAFFYSIPHRFLLGDRPLIDEWHVSQFSGLLQYIPFRIYYSFFGTEGIILFFRRLYVVLQLIVSLLMFWRMRDYGVCALISSILFFTHTIMGYCVLNYYVLSLLPVTCIAMLLFFGKELRWYGYVIVGFLTAAAVLAEPTFALVYFGYLFAVLFRFIFRRSKKTDGLLVPKHFFLITSGIAAIAIVVIAFMLSRASVSEYISAIPDMLTDPEHKFSFSMVFDRLFSGFTDAVVNIGVPLFLCLTVLFLVILFDKKRNRRRYAYSIIAAVLCVGVLLDFVIRYFSGEKLLFLMRHFPLYFFGAFCWLLLENKKENRRLLRLYLFGLVFSFVITLSSDSLSQITFLMGGVFADSAVIVLAKELYRELKAGAAAETQKSKSGFLTVIKKAAPVLLAAAVLVPLLIEIVDLPFKKDYLYVENRILPDIVVEYEGRDYDNSLTPSYTVALVPTKVSLTTTARIICNKKPERLDSKIASGPLKGIYTVSEYAENYQLILNDLDKIKNSGAVSAYIFAPVAMSYLYLDQPYSTISSYFLQQDYEPRQLRYWELQPDRIPSFIYVPKVLFPSYDNYDISDRIELVKRDFDCDIQETQVGVICKINGQRDKQLLPSQTD